MVWEGAGVGAEAKLTAGPAIITLAPVHDSDYCCWGDRNIDVIVLHPNSTDVERRINGTADPADGQVLPLDGLFSQSGEVFFKVQVSARWAWARRASAPCQLPSAPASRRSFLGL